MRVAQAKRPTNGIFGTKVLCFVLSMRFPKIIRKPGITRNTESRENRMALIRQTAMSGPSLNCMNIMAIRPPTVVRLLAPISGIAFDREMMTASRRSCVSYSSLNRLL